MGFSPRTHLIAVLLLVVLTACRTAPSPPASTPTAYLPASSPLPSAPQPTATSLPQPTITPTVIPTQAQGLNRIAAAIQISRPSSMAVGEGFLWVVSGSSVVRIDPKMNAIAGKPIAAGIQFESDIALGENALWVTSVGSGDLGEPNETDAVNRIDLQTGETVATIKVSRGPVSLALTPGAVWVVNFGMNGDAVTQIDAKTNQITGEPVQTGHAPISLAVGDGSVWVANHDAGTVTRFDPQNAQIIANIDVPSEPHRIAFGEGAVWVSNWHENSVTRIDPQTNQVMGEPIDIGVPAGNIVAGLGSVWVTSDYRVEGKDKVVVRIDPQANQAVETILLKGHPIDVAVTEDSVWVSVQSPDSVLRINPK